MAVFKIEVVMGTKDVRWNDAGEGASILLMISSDEEQHKQLPVMPCVLKVS